MEFTNMASTDARVSVYNQTDTTALIARWSGTVKPGETIDYRPRDRDARQYRASITASSPEGGTAKEWVEDLRDEGQSVEIHQTGNELTLNAVLDPLHDPANWMGNLASSIEHRDLRQIIIPGTHDSGSFSADMTPAVRTQDKDFDFQLRNGIRYFDLRVTHSTASPALGFRKDTFYLCHNCVSARELEFERQLAAVAEFAAAHPEEIVLLDFHELTEGIYPYPVGGAKEMNEATRGELLAMVTDHVGDRMVPLDASTTIGDLWAAGTNVVVFFHGDSPSTWPQERIKVLWDTYSSTTEVTASVAKKIASLKAHLERELPLVDSDQVFNNAAGGVWNVAIRLSANDVNRHLVGWLEDWHGRPEFRNKLNVVSVDFFQYSDVVQTATRLNGLRT